MVISFFSSEIVLPSGHNKLCREFTIRAVAPCCDLSRRFSNTCDLDTEKYRRFAAVAKTSQLHSAPIVDHPDIFGNIRHGNRARTEAMLRDDESLVHARDENGNTPLIVAVQNNQMVIAGLLIAKGADVDARNSKGNTALHFATKFNYDDIKRKLIEEWNANPNIRNSRWLLCADKQHV